MVMFVLSGGGLQRLVNDECWAVALGTTKGSSVARGGARGCELERRAAAAEAEAEAAIEAEAEAEAR